MEVDNRRDSATDNHSKFPFSEIRNGKEAFDCLVLGVHTFSAGLLYSLTFTYLSALLAQGHASSPPSKGITIPLCVIAVLSHYYS